MPRRLEIDEDLFLRAEQHCPKYLSTTGFINLIIDQGLTSNLGAARLRANCVGAEDADTQKLPLQFPPELEVTSTSSSTNTSNSTKKRNGVGRESEGNPRKGESRKPENRKIHFPADETHIPDDLSPVSAELLDFWENKGGMTTKRAWDGLLRECRKIIQDKNGSINVIRDELNNAATRGQAGIEYSRWLAYSAKPKAKPQWQQEPEMKHPAHRDFTAERIAAEKEGNQNFLGF